jgi:hypothetical protein
MSVARKTVWVLGAGALGCVLPLAPSVPGRLVIDPERRVHEQPAAVYAQKRCPGGHGHASR